MRRLLIVNPFGIGDVLFSLASAQRIRQVHPEARLGFLCNERTESLVRLCPSVDTLHVFDRGGLRALWKKSPVSFFKELKRMAAEVSAEKYDTLIDFSLGREFSAAAFFVGIADRIGLDYKNRGIFLTRKKKIDGYENIPVAQQQIDFLHEAGILPDNRMPERIPLNLPEQGKESGLQAPWIAAAPGGGRSWGENAIYKQWDPEKFAHVLNRLASDGVSRRVMILGDRSEEPLLENVKARIQAADSVVMAGRPLAEVCAVLKRCRVLLCNDGGLMHLAHALGVKTVSIFGPVDEKVYGPYGGSVPHRVLVQPVPCRPCYRHFHFPPCAFQRRCLTELSADKVIEAIREIL